MIIRYFVEPEINYVYNENGNLDSEIQSGYDSEVIGDLEYCCEALEKNFWLELMDPEYYENDNPRKIKEPKIVLGFANYSGGYTIVGGEDGIKFCPFCGEKIVLELVKR